MQSFIKKMTGVEYNLTYVREMMRKWGFSMKVPVMRHVNRAGNRKIARFKKRMRNILETAGKEWTVGVEDESIVVADSRPRRGSTRWDAGGPYTRTTDPIPRPSSSGLSPSTEGDSSSGMRHLPRRSLWTFWRRRTSGSARP